MKTKSLPSFCLMLIGAAVALPQGVDGQVERSLWSNPVFQKRLMGSFGFNSEVEPTLTETEQEDYEQIAPLLQDDQEQALGLLQQMAALEGSSARFDFLIGNIYFQKDKKREAMAAMLKAVEKFPPYRQAHNNLAILFVQTGNNAEAIKHFTEAIRLGAVDGTTYGLLGLAYVGTQNYLAAEECFRNAIVLNPDVKDWEMGLIQALYSQQKFTEVISIMDRMIQKSPEDEKLWLLQANAFLGKKEILAAATNFEVVDQMGKLPPANLNTLADIYVNEGLLEVAAQAYLRAYELDKTAGVSGPLRAAEILMAKEGYEAARGLLDQVRSQSEGEMKNEDAIKVLKLEAKIGMAEGAEEEAAQTLKKVVEKDPLDGESLILLGQYEQRIGGTEEAANYYEQAAGIKGHEATANVRLAQLRVGQAKYEDAIQLLKRAQDIEPRDSVARFLEELERFQKQRR